MAAREVAAQIIEKMAQEYARYLHIEPYLWEYEPMLASGHFQDSMEPPSCFDVVILILESRLGTPLPERTAVREYRGIDGRTPVTGTEWEFEDALAGARTRGIPDLLVYRSNRDATVSTWDSQKRQAMLAQIEALEAFWSRHFADQGKFIGGYARFNNLEEFARKLEQHLRRCVERRIQAANPAERATTDRLWSGAPFRGLEAYEFEDAPIFFGRDEAIGSALLRLVTNAQANRPFLLILGASGSGKSSLVKAGVVPRLLVPQRVSGTAFLRRVVFRPSDAHADEDLFDALARRVTESVGEGTGLVELLGHSMTVADLARHLREASAHPDLPFAMVLDRLAEGARARGRMLEYEKAKCILIVDQLEELFTVERVRTEERKRFIELMGGLVRSGIVWLVATMRADFWHRAAETPELVELADGHGRLDLLPPTPAELSQMIRRPAEAAALSFEVHPASGIPLNDLIAEEAAREPGALPLLSYLLDQLYLKDVHEGGASTLSYASYNALGGLKGAIATRADAVIRAQPLEGQRALRQVLFALVQISATEGSIERAVARRAPMSDFPEGTAKRQLVQALLDPSARLLVAEASGSKGATVRLAHEALVSEWRTAGEYVAANAEALKTRRNVEEHYTRWRALGSEEEAKRRPHGGLSWPTMAALRVGFGREPGLLTEVDLIDAKRLLQGYRDELAPELFGYIERSLAQDRRRRRRTLRAVAAIAGAMTVLAIGAVYEAQVARQQRDAGHQSYLRSLTETAWARLQDGDVSQATGIILEVLNDRGTQTPVTPEALSVFQRARAADAQINVITGHADRVYSAKYSADNTRLVTASDDRTARIWDALAGTQILQLTGHSARVQSAVFSPDGRLIITASLDGTARIWSAITGQQIKVLVGHNDALQAAEFSPDGTRAVTASRDGTARVWDVQTGQQSGILRGHTDGVYSAAFSRDGARIVTASADKTARIWNTAGEPLITLRGHLDAVWSAAFSPDGLRVVTASADKTARIWDSRTGQTLVVLAGHTDDLYEASFSPDGRRVVTASADLTARVWDSITGQQTEILKGHGSYVLAAQFSPDGQRIVTASDDKTVRVWGAESPWQLLELHGHTKPLFDAQFSPDGRRVVTASADRTARIWDANNGTSLIVLSGHSDRVTSASYSPDGTAVATSSFDKTLRIWSSNTGQQLAELTGSPQALATVEFSPDGRDLVTAGYDNTARIWDVRTGACLRILRGHTDRVETATFSPDGKHIVTSSDDKTARIWSATRGDELLVLTGHSDALETAQFSSDGRLVITAANDGTARIWDAATGKQLLLVSEHRGHLDSAAFSPDGRLFITASDDGTASIWNTSTGQQLLTLLGHEGRIEFAAFAPDGRRLVTAADDSAARVFQIRIPPINRQVSWVAAAQFDPLSSDERTKLGLSNPTERRGRSGDVTQCDELAAAPYDPDRRASGVLSTQIGAQAALGACSPQRSISEGDARMIYQHGRALVTGKSFSAAKAELETAVGFGYRSARIDLAELLLDPAAGMVDVPKARELYEDSWRSGVSIAAFELGALYERGVQAANGQQLMSPDPIRAWSWYQKGADANEPNALARFGAGAEGISYKAPTIDSRDALLLKAFTYYAAAAEFARAQDWPDDAWRSWRWRRASLARVLLREGMMEQVSVAYDRELRRTVPQ